MFLCGVHMSTFTHVQVHKHPCACVRSEGQRLMLRVFLDSSLCVDPELPSTASVV